MLILKHLKTLQHVSIFIQIIFRELIGSLLKSVNLNIFKNVKGQLWWCGSIMFGVCAWPRIGTNELHSVALRSPQWTVSLQIQVIYQVLKCPQPEEMIIIYILMWAGKDSCACVRACV